jgi:uncharacterized protein
MTKVQLFGAFLGVSALVGPAVVAGQTRERGKAVTVGTATAAPGQRAIGVIHVPAGIDAGYDIPVAVVNGTRSGPVLAVVSGSHGTEYASILAVEMMMAEGVDANARLDPAAMAGAVILVPLVNVASFDRLTPHVNPVDNKNMNRFYPGSATGTQTERASYVLTKEVVERSDHLIDLHGGDLDENLRPYTYWTVTGNARQDEVSRGMALAFGFDHIIISSDRPKDPNASRYLENTASTRGKPSITAEAGRSGPVDRNDPLLLIRGVRGVMGYLKMIQSGPPPVAKPIWIDTLVNVAAEHDGVFYPAVSRDAHVLAGARIGVIRDHWYRKIADVDAPRAGTVLFIRALPSLKKGDTIASIGVAKK